MTRALPHGIDEILASADHRWLCPECAGASEWSQRQPCKACNFSGVLPVPSENPCRKCHGRAITVTSSGDVRECVKCHGFGMLFTRCTACGGIGSTAEKTTCHYCDDDGKVSFIQMIARNGDRAYVSLLLSYVEQYSKGTSEAAVRKAAAMMMLVYHLMKECDQDRNGLTNDLFDREAGLRAEAAFTKILARIGVSERKRNSRRSSNAAKLAEDQRRRREELEEARLDQIREAARRSEDHSRIVRELEEKFGKEAL